MKSRRYRSRLFQADISEILSTRRRRRDFHTASALNFSAHRRHHTPRALIHTSKTTLVTTAQSAFKLPFSAKLIRISTNVQTAPSGDLTYDVLADGNTIFHTSAKPTIPSGQVNGGPSLPDRISFPAGTSFYVQITTINSAVGPMVTVFEFEPEFHD